MKIFELIKRLEEEKKTNGDIGVLVEVEHTCGDYGDHNCKSGADIDDIFTQETTPCIAETGTKITHLVLAGRE